MKENHHLQDQKRRMADWRMIVEMIDAAMQLAYDKGPHPLEAGCNCIACVNKRKQVLAGPPKPWRYRL